MENSLKIATCLVTFLFAFIALPKISDAFLKWKYKKMNERWYRCLDMTIQIDDRAQSKSLKVWKQDQITALKSGKLSQARAQALIESGITTGIDKDEPLIHSDTEKDHFAFKPNLLQRTLCALCSALMPATLALLNEPLLSIAIISLIGIIQTMICICDCAARIIPIQLCFCYGCLSVLWILVARNTDDLPLSLLLGLVSFCFVVFTETIALKLTNKSAIGDGDRRLIPLIAFQVGLMGFMPGLIALCFVALAMAIWALAHGKSKRSYLPFAPPLYAWVAAGTLMPLVF